MSPYCVWIITAGGGVDKSIIKFPNIVMLTELGKYNNNIIFTEFSVYKCGVSAREIFKIVFMWVWLYDYIKTHAPITALATVSLYENS